MKSTHKAEVVPVVLEKHPNADALSIVKVFGYTVVVNTKQWDGIDRGVYIVPDSLVDASRPEFSFLSKVEKALHLTGEAVPEMVRVKTMKLRGVNSMGLLIPCPEGFEVGDDCAEFLGVQRYEPEFQGSTGGDCVAGPSFVFSPSKYDIDSYHRYLDLFEDGELVNVTEKIHGANARFCCMNDINTEELKAVQYCGSRTQWKKESATDIWWRAYYNTPGIKAFCEDNKGLILWGEVYGQVQNLKYGLKDVGFVAFDIFDVLNGRFYNVEEFQDACIEWQIPEVPLIKNNWPLNKKEVLDYAEGKSILHWSNIGGQLQNCHVREGCVIKPMKERWTEEVGRLALKIVGNGYYQLKG